MSEPRLDVDTELALARRWRDHRDPVARARLLHAHQFVVRHQARKLCWFGCSPADLEQEGNLGFLRALDRFDPERGVRLATYAAWWIRAFMLRFIEHNGRLVRHTSTASLDAPALAHEGDGARRMDHVAAPVETPEQSLESAELRARLDSVLERFGATLSGRPLEMFRERVANARPASLHELSERWGITRAAARRIERRVAQPLRRFIYREMGDTIAATLGAA